MSHEKAYGHKSYPISFFSPTAVELTDKQTVAMIKAMLKFGVKQYANLPDKFYTYFITIWKSSLSAVLDDLEKTLDKQGTVENTKKSFPSASTSE